jgi:NAD(P)-dependent dehydrogenase (short-subunit alcohol dehydrogenase family)
MKTSLENKTYLIAGGSKGIGLALTCLVLKVAGLPGK